MFGRGLTQTKSVGRGIGSGIGKTGGVVIKV